ncbi:MAG: glycosyltransferase, partial [Microgenomates group bacterium]
PKYLYGYETPSNWQKHLIIRIYGNFINHFLRMYDFSSSQTVDHFIVNSQEMQRRCAKFYRRDSTVVYPPVSIPEKIPVVAPNKPKPSYYLSICRLSSPKHVDLLIKAANKVPFTLKVVGIGGHEAYLRSIAGPTVEFVGSVPDKQFEELFEGAKAFLFAGVDEEFGIAPVEALGRGVPLIAYNSGGLKETVLNGKNGFLFDELTENSLIEAINKLEKLSAGAYGVMRKAARAEAEKYSEEHFVKTITRFVREHLHNNH